MRKLLLILLLAPACLSYAQKKNDPGTFAKTITPEDLKKHLYIVAGKEMEGRETATEGQKKAAAYIEAQFKAIGLLPGNNGSYQYYYPVYRDSAVQATLEINGTAYEQNKDFSPASNNYNSTFRFSEVVFVGYGISDSTMDDYKGLDVRGKAVLIISGTPPGGKTISNNVKLASAQKNGAIAALFISSTGVQSSGRGGGGGGMYLNAFRGSYPLIQYVISEKLAEAIMGGDYAQAKAGAVVPKSYTANVFLNFNKQISLLQSSNVMGMLEGTDLKDEYVFVTAHYDHLGKRGDTVIYYGADDDGSGTVSVIEMAEAFAKAKAAGKGPRRTMIFMTVSGEEKGLWGSQSYTNKPVYPLEKTSVDLNIDMIGRTDTSRHHGDINNYVYV
ncbi:MAG TPA: M28 family peptidase, partial [Chitinophagaceae bacterium]|nr:M28 family peptidase [Chitinophagaceae bacterium]